MFTLSFSITFIPAFLTNRQELISRGLLVPALFLAEFLILVLFDRMFFTLFSLIMIIQLFVPYLLAVRKTEEWMISQMSFSEAILCFFCTSMFLYMKRLYFEGVFLILYNSGLMTIFTSLPL